MAATLETSIWMALKARVESLALSPAVPVVYPRQDAPEGRHIRVLWLPNTNQRRAVNSNGAHIRPSILQLSLYSPSVPNQAAEVDIQIGGQIAAHFPADLRMEFNGIVARVTSAPTIAQAFRDDAWWTTPVSISVEFLI